MRNYLAKADIGSGEIYSQVYSSFDKNYATSDITLTIKFSKIDSKIKDFQCRFIGETRLNPIPYKYRTFNISYDFYNGSTTNPIFGPTTVQYNSVVEPDDPETATISPVYGIYNRIYTPGNTFVDWLANVNEVINQVPFPDPSPSQSSTKIDIELLSSYTIDTVGYIELYSAISQVGDLIDPTNTQNSLSQISVDTDNFEKTLSDILNVYLDFYGPEIGNQSTIDYVLEMFFVLLKNPTSEYISIYDNNNGKEINNNGGRTAIELMAILLAIDVQFFSSNLTVNTRLGELAIDHFTTTILYGPGLTYDKIDIVRG